MKRYHLEVILLGLVIIAIAVMGAEHRFTEAIERRHEKDLLGAYRCGHEAGLFEALQTLDPTYERDGALPQACANLARQAQP